MVVHDSRSSAWPNLPIHARCDHVARMGTVIARRQKEISRTVTEETGKPCTEVINQEITASLEMLRACSRTAPRLLRPEHFRYWRPGFWAKSNTIVFEPLGIVLIIGPSNFPFSLPVMQSCAALLCGNCVILKPSELCPRTASLIDELFAEARIPDGAVEVVHGGPEIAERLIARPDVHKVVFTGSCATGRKVAETCGRAFKPCILELGGGSPAIIRADADLGLAARGIAWSAIYANGRSCVGARRVYVHASAARRFVELLEGEIGKIRIGDPADHTTELGSFSNPAAAERVAELLRDAVEKGAEIRAGKEPAGDLRSLCGKAPVLILGASPEMRVMQDEAPWPMLAIREVGSDDQAILEANQAGAGLGASVWSRDLKRAHAVARALQAGMVWVNDSSVGLPDFPWGGRNQSGWGRMFSKHGLRELTNIKVISIERQRLSRSKMWWFPYSEGKHDIFEAANDWYTKSGRVKTLFRLLSALVNS